MIRSAGVATVALIMSTAVQADSLAPITPSPANTQAPIWTGFYAGLNAGYSWDAFGSASASGLNAASPSWTPSGLPNSGSGQVAANYLSALSSGATGVAADGFLGGLQAGYNYQFHKNFVAGFEVDFQGSTARGQGNLTNAAAWGNAFGPYNGTFNVPYNVYSDGTPSYWQVTPGGNATVPTTIYIPYNLNGSGNYSPNGVSVTTITKRMNSLGTVRGRIGYLITPDILAYATGGMAYGNVSVTTTNTQLLNGNVSGSGTFSTTDPGVNPCGGGVTNNCGLTNYSLSPSLSFPINGISNGRNFYSTTKVGWTVGGGLEWMFAKNWSVKSEYIYYSLGSVTTRGGYTAMFNSQSGAVQAGVSQMTSTAFGGHIARAGVNYHLTLDAFSSPLARIQ